VVFTNGSGRHWAGQACTAWFIPVLARTDVQALELVEVAWPISREQQAAFGLERKGEQAKRAKSGQTGQTHFPGEIR